jgi:hypothetical protein
MLDFLLKAQLAQWRSAAPSSVSIRASPPFFLAHLPVCASAWFGLVNRQGLLPQRQQFFNFGQREPQFLGMAYKFQLAICS